MIYVVSGFPKTMTSMMMYALRAGGMEIAFDPARDEMNKVHGDSHYTPNRAGFYETIIPELAQPVVDLDAPADPAWIRQFRGKVVKLVSPWLKYLGDVPHEAVYMTRDPEEIRQSFEAMTGYNLDREKGYKGSFVETYPLQVERDLSMLHNPVVLDAREVIENSVRELSRIPWGFDVEAAAATIDPSRYRFRIESLVVGI